MDDGKKAAAKGDKPLEGQEEATCGWDPYLSDLLQEKKAVTREERRRRPRDRTPARRRSILVTGEDDESRD